MNLEFLNENLFSCLAFKKNYYFKTKPFLTKAGLSNLEYYLQERFLQHHPLIHNPKNWTVNKNKRTAFFKLTDQIPLLEAEYLKYSRLPFSDQINHLLQDEYGYLLPEIMGGSWELREVPLHQLIFPNQDYLKQLDQEVVQDYIQQLQVLPELIGGLFIPKSSEYYKLIDGYHRLFALKQFFEPDHRINIITYQRD